MTTELEEFLRQVEENENESQIPQDYYLESETLNKLFKETTKIFVSENGNQDLTLKFQEYNEDIVIMLNGKNDLMYEDTEGKPKRVRYNVITILADDIVLYHQQCDKNKDAVIL